MLDLSGIDPESASRVRKDLTRPADNFDGPTREAILALAVERLNTYEIGTFARGRLLCTVSDTLMFVEPATVRRVAAQLPGMKTRLDVVRDAIVAALPAETTANA